MASSDQSRPPTAAKAETPSPELSSATDVTTPSPTNELFDDVFGSAPPSPQGLSTLPGGTVATTPGIDEEALPASGTSHREFSDIARLRSTHTTAGYREGLSAAKDAALQPGFDEGYSLGAALGMQAGLIMGILDVIPDAIEGEDAGDVTEKLRSLAEHCRRELQQSNLLSDEYIDMEGLWSWQVPTDADVHHVAAAHPVISRWQKQADDLCRALGIGAGKLDKRWVDEDADGATVASSARSRRGQMTDAATGDTKAISRMQMLDF